MTVDTEAAAIVRAALRLPNRRKDPSRLHCVYCTIVVGESTWHKDRAGDMVESWEPYAEMLEGPVCWRCVADYERVKASHDQAQVRAENRVQLRQGRGRKIRNKARKERNMLIMRLAAEGWSCRRIGIRVGLTYGGVSSVLRAARAQA